jgi:hypothetical protein
MMMLETGRRKKLQSIATFNGEVISTYIAGSKFM